MGKASELLDQIFKEDKTDKKDDKDLVPINEPEEDDFSDLNIDDGDKEKKPVVDYTAEIIKFFKANPNPKDDKVHDLADQLGLEPSELEGKIYGVLSTYLQTGRHQDSPDEDFDAEQIKMGIEVEKEHTDSPALAKEIAKDHLAEIPDYYTRLKKMEDEGKAEKDKKPEKPAEDENDV